MPPSQGLSRADVEAILEEKIKGYRRIVYAFLLGLGGLFLFLVANQLLSKRSLLVFLHDQLFGSDRYLGEVIDSSVALSYSEQFSLAPAEGVRYISFYASDTQKVILLTDVKHYGPGARSKVIIRLDHLEKPIFDEASDLNFEKVDLTESVRSRAQFASGAEHVHTLTFQLDPEQLNPQDVANIRILANVIGLEKKAQ
jgi:hypothetical protein